MTPYDIIIIGSGLGGLVCGNVLSKEGYKVCVLEKNPRFGGCLQSYKHQGCMIDTGIHYVGCMDEGQILNQYFKYLGIMDKLKIKRLDEDAFDVINIMGKEYKHAMGHENFIETLSQYFPAEHKNIRSIVHTLQSIGDLIHPNILKNEKRFSISGLPYFGVSASEFINQHTSNKDLQNVLTGTSVLCGGEKENTSLYVFATITNSNIESSYRFVDGSQQVADLLIENIRANGGEVRSGAEVTHIHVVDGLATSVEINRSEIIEGKNFISNVHPAQTLELLEKTKAIKKAYISRINSLKNSMGFLTVSLRLKDDSFKYLNKNYYHYEGKNIWTADDYAKTGLKKALFCTSATSGSESCRIAQILEPMYWHEVEKWADTQIGKRGEEYKALKHSRAEQIIDFVEERHPGLKESILAYTVSTPLTYRDYTGTKNGSAYGITKDYNNALVALLPSRTRIPNLHFSGQNNNVHGMIGVILTAMYTCSEFIDMNYLAEKVGNA